MGGVWSRVGVGTGGCEEGGVTGAGCERSMECCCKGGGALPRDGKEVGVVLVAAS